MGLMASWLGFLGRDHSGIIAEFGLAPTGDEVWPGTRSAPFSILTLPSGWTILFSEKFDFVTPERVLELSAKGWVVGCRFDDKVTMESAIFAAKNGAEIWRVVHAPERGIMGLDVRGVPPVALTGIRERLERSEAEGEEDGSVDFMHDVAHELGLAVCGYRVDDEPSLFTGLRMASEPWPPVRRSLFSSLFRALTGKGAD
jgi:hypothetical protein